MVINRKLIPWIVAGVALVAILLIVLVMVTQAAPNSAPHRQGATSSPDVVSYQGQVNIGGVPFSGTGYFRFAIVDTGGTFYWSNDSNTITPTDAVTLTVVNGLFNALLGETNPITYGMFSNSDRWLRVWFDDGTHGVQLLEPDTRVTTAPFAFQADNATMATTAITATSFKTSKPNIVGDPFDGYTRGIWSVDLQLNRNFFLQTAYGPYATISGGSKNYGGGSYSAISGGWENYALGYVSTVMGGRLNKSLGNYCVASGFRASTGTGPSPSLEPFHGVFIFGDSTDEDFNGITDNEFTIRARGGFRHAYDNSNWWTAKVTSGGAVTFDAVGTTPGFTISDSLTVNGVFSGTVLTATYATTALTATNATTATYAITATTALTATNATTATIALTATNATTATFATTALTATNATTATFATTALTATNATTATFAMTALTATDGTKTVTLVPGSGSITMGANTLAYTKIGRVVHVTGYIDVGSVSNPGGALTLTGLPFTCASGVEFYSALSISAAGLAATATTALQGYVVPGTTTAQIERFAAGGAAWPAADVKAGSYFILSMTYLAET